MKEQQMRIRHLRATILMAVILIMLGNGLRAQGSLTNVSINLSNNSAGESAIYTFTFTTSSSAGGIPSNGKIEFIFPTGFSIGDVDIAQSKSLNMTGGFSGISVKNKNSANEDTVRLARDWSGNDVDGSIEVSVAIGMVTNHTSKASIYEVKINTMTTGEVIIDTGTTPDFTIIAGSVHHFLVVTSGNATVGQSFPITITAQDAYNNTVTSFASQATLTDKSGTISPTITGSFSSGVRSENLTFTKSYTNNQVIVTYDNKSGNSALFNVLPGTLDHFSFNTISSPQAAGTSFGITISAKDQYDNIVTSFTDQVTLTDISGSLNTTSNTFVSGALTQNVTITKSQTDNYITANHISSGKSGTSNKFNLTAGNLAKFYIDPISSPQAAGVWFAINVTAQDQYNNIVTSFNSTVNISDLSGTIAPSTSGNFSGGQWTGQVKIGSSYTNNIITVMKPTTGETGASTTFNVTVGSLDHFVISTVSTQTAGVSFSITITAKDIGGNTITSFSGPVTLGDLTGTISPKSSGGFSNGIRNETVTITGAMQSNQIIVTSSDKNGTSNAFIVNPNSLNHFTFTDISSPITAGQSFSISIQARDEYENIVTSFSSAVDLSDKTGTLTPTSSGNFSSGSKTVSITITKKLTDDQVTALSSGKSGKSNNFNVQANSIHHIMVRDIPAGLGNEVGDLTLNLDDQVVLYAAGYDQWNNYVREVAANWSRTGTIDLPSPLTGTNTTFMPATPQTSGQIYADSSGMTDYTGTITVGNVHHVLIRDAADGNGNVINSKTITADDSLKLYAAAYDQGNNYLGPAIVSWSSNGNLQPAIAFSNMSTIVFAPTQAPASGQIIANHATATDYTTGTIAVKQGAPVGKIVLHPNPKSIPAHPDSNSVIISEVIYDSDGNPIAQGELFTVSTTIGKIASPADQSLGIVGHQVKSDGSSKINFTVNADSAGGVAVIYANSVGKGSAVGDTIINICSIQIVSINTDIEHLSQGQTNVPVRMTVQNQGVENVVIATEGTSLRFIDSNRINRSGEYVVSRSDTAAVIPRFGGQRTLTFDVAVSQTATADLITINGTFTGLVNGKAVSDSTANLIDKWLVQTPPALRIERVEASNDTVVQGKITTATLTIRNDGDASIVIDSDSLTFWSLNQSKNVTNEYGQVPFQSNPDTIVGHGSQVFSFYIQVGAAATLDTIQINAKAIGHDANTGLSYSDNNADFGDGWRVKLASDVTITKFEPSQMTVTSGQDQDWHLVMVVNNSGGSDFKLDSAKVKFTIGAFNITNQYQIINPNQFLMSGSDTLTSGTTDTLKFTVEKTGTTLGTITIEGTVYCNDMFSGQTVKNAFTGIIIQSPAQLKIDFVRTSQTEVTVSQTYPWKAIVALTNSGGSDVLIDTTQIKTFIDFIGDDGFNVILPTGFYTSGNFQLSAGASDSLFFTVDTTGNLVGARQLNTKIVGKEVNSNRAITVQQNTSITVETPANIRISKTLNTAPNAPYVDSKQLFQIAVIVQNSGQDGARDIAISLVTDSLSTILNPAKTLNFVEGGTSDTLNFDVQAYDGWTISEIFTAKIDTARAENTPEPDKILISPALDSIDTATVHRPAKMKIRSVLPSQTSVRALIQDEWQIRIAVMDSGAAFIKLNQPLATDITILMEGEPQQDYTIIPPTDFKNSKDLTLSWWAEDTLIYRVTRTGIVPGHGKIKVNLSGKYLNTDTPFQISDSTEIYIQPSADVFIESTEPVCPHIDQYGIAQVNTNQQFIVKSKIRNTGVSRVDSVLVSLKATGYTIQPRIIPFIQQSSYAWVSFNVVAQKSPAEKVNFIAKIVSAISHEGGLPVTIGLPSDSLASAKIYTPALLKLAINRADSIFSVGTRGSFRVTVQNMGTAEVDSSGEISVQMPEGYHVIVNEQEKSEDTRGFKINQPVTWQVLPPPYISQKDTMIVAINKPPLDTNTKLFAEKTNPYDTLIVKTVTSMLAINSFKIIQPAGAMDDTLSTNQDFAVQLVVSPSENLTNIQAVLTRPEGFSFGMGMDSIRNVVNQKANWILKTPKDAHLIPQWIKVKVTGTAGAENISARDSIAVVTVREAVLSFGRVEITWPNTDSTLSVQQEFDLSATVVNYGEAKLESLGYLKIGLGATKVTAILQDTIKSFIPGVPVTWRLRAPDVETIKAPITVSINTIPNDENTNEVATTTNRFTYFYVETQNSGTAFIDSLWITSPSGALDKVLSTQQTFTIEANVRWYNCIDKPRVTLQLAGGFTTRDPNPNTPSGTDQQGRVSWTLTAPEEAVQNQFIWLELSAQDSNSYRQFTVTSDSLQLYVVNRAEVQLNASIVSPPSAQDHVVSTGEQFIVRAFLTNSGEARLKGNYTTTLTLPDGQGYTLMSNQSPTAAASDSIYWTIKAPIYETEINDIKIQLINFPKDENTSVAVVPGAVVQGGFVTLRIQTEEKAVTVSNFDLREKHTVVRGDTAIPMLGIELICSGTANSNNVLLSGVKVKVKDRLGNLILNPASVLSRIALTKYHESSLVYGQVTAIPSNNPIEILFTRTDTLKPEITNKIELRVDVLDNTEITDFQLAIDSTDALYLVDEGSGQVPKLKNKDGQKLELLNITSNPSVIIASDFNEAFRNYPNPFGNPNRPQTKFIYYLDQDSDVEIKIFTLIGELVWSQSYTSNDPQGKRGQHEADIVWDARNEKGYLVLNGVYLARILTGYGKSALTKIAVIK